MRLTLLPLVVCFIGFFSIQEGFSQTVLHSESDIIISSEEVRCQDIQNGIDKQYQILSIENTGKQAKQVFFQIEAWYNGKCFSCGNDEYQITRIIQPKEVLSGECPLGAKSGLEVFVRHNEPMIPNRSEFERLELSNIKIVEGAKD